MLAIWVKSVRNRHFNKMRFNIWSLETIINKEKLDIKKLDKLVSELQIFGKALEQTQIELRKEFVASVNYAMNRIWQTLYPYQDYPSIRLSIEEGDYVLQLQGRNGDWNDVEGILSGGERSLAALALRIAFSLVLAPLTSR